MRHSRHPRDVDDALIYGLPDRSNAGNALAEEGAAGGDALLTGEEERRTEAGSVFWPTGFIVRCAERGRKSSR